MTASKGRASTSAPAELEQPAAGGSYVRQTDGTLKRVEFTEEAAIAEPEADAPPVGDSEDKGA